MTIEVFELFRTALFVAVSVYYLLVSTAGLIGLRRLLRGGDANTRIVRTLVGYLVATVSLRPFRSELLQIGLLLVLLAGIWWSHGLIEVHG